MSKGALAEIGTSPWLHRLHKPVLAPCGKVITSLMRGFLMIGRWCVIAA